MKKSLKSIFLRKTYQIENFWDGWRLWKGSRQRAVLITKLNNGPNQGNEHWRAAEGEPRFQREGNRRQDP